MASMTDTPITLDAIKALRKQRKYAEALAACGVYIAANPEDPDGYRQRAYLHSGEENFAAAVDDLDRVVALEPNHPASHFTRGRIRLRGGDAAAAAEDFTRAAELDDGWYGPAVYLFRAECFCQLGRYDEALADCARVPDNYKMPGFRMQPDGSKHHVIADIRIAKAKATTPRRWRII
jgi:tetratricopeptide (TPR) repeat protein